MIKHNGILSIAEVDTLWSGLRLDYGLRERKKTDGWGHFKTTSVC